MKPLDDKYKQWMDLLLASVIGAALGVILGFVYAFAPMPEFGAPSNEWFARPFLYTGWIWWGVFGTAPAPASTILAPGFDLDDPLDFWVRSGPLAARRLIA